MAGDAGGGDVAGKERADELLVDRAAEDGFGDGEGLGAGDPLAVDPLGGGALGGEFGVDRGAAAVDQDDPDAGGSELGYLAEEGVIGPGVMALPLNLTTMVLPAAQGVADFVGEALAAAYADRQLICTAM